MATMWTITPWQDIPAPVRLDVEYRTEQSYYGFHHGYGHTAYVSEDRVFASPLDAAAYWCRERLRRRNELIAETDRVLARLMPDVFG